MVHTAVVQKYIDLFKCNVPKDWIEILSACGDQITLTQSDVHNKTVYTICQPTPSKSSVSEPEVTQNMRAMTLAANQAQPPKTDSDMTRVVKTVNGGSNGLVDSTDFESKGDMLAIPAIIPPAISPPLSVNPTANDYYFDVFCTWAANPHHFSIQPYANIQSDGPLLKLLHDMKEFYDNEENRVAPVAPSLVKKGIAYATKQPDTYWYRVIVDSIVPDSDPLQVVCLYVDTGFIKVLTTEVLEPLFSQFQKLPRQAIKASLSSEYPKS